MPRQRFPESLKRQALGQVLAGTSLRHLAETLGIAESLVGKWKCQYEQQDDAFPGNGKQRGESAELRRLRWQLNRPGGSRHLTRSLRNAFQTLSVTADC